MTRRFLLVVTLALALLLPGCIEIANPQFDARYQPRRTIAVFAVWEYDRGPNPPIGSRVTQLILADVARPSSAVTIPLAAFGVSDVQVVRGRPKLLVAEDEFLAEVDLLTRRVSKVTTAPSLPEQSDVRGLGAAYAQDGARISWYESTPGMRFTVIRRDRLSRERSASVSFLDLFQSVSPMKDWRATWSADKMMFLAADERLAYFVSSSPLPWDQRLPRTTVWRADFVSGTISEVRLGGVHRFPVALEPTRHTHADRAMRRFGIPVQGIPNQVTFLSLTGGVRATSALPTPPVEVIVQPGGSRYLERRPTPVEWGKAQPSAEGTVTFVQGSFGQTSTAVLLERKRAAVAGLAFASSPVGLIGDVLAYSEATSSASANGGPMVRLDPYGPPPAVSLRFYDTRTRRDSFVATASGPDGAPGPLYVEYLGSYTR